MRLGTPVLAAAAGVLLFAGAARAQDKPPAPAPGPAPAPATPPAKPLFPPEDPLTAEVEEDRVTLENGMVVWYYTVNFVSPLVLQGELDKWKSTDGKIEASAVPTGQFTNVLRIVDHEENVALMERLLEILDQPVPQVLVKAKLVEITYTGKLEVGFEANYAAPGDTAFRDTSAVFNPESFLNATSTRPFQGGTVNFALVGDSSSNYGSLEYALRMLKSKGKVEVLGEPNILATQGLKATIKAGESVPIQSANLSGGNLIVSTLFKDTGVTLEITPEVIGRDAVKLKLKESLSAVTGFVLGQGGTQNPVVNTREAETTLTLRDGATLIVGGLQSSRSITTQSGIPLLMDIPVLGWLFSYNSKEETKTELYFMVTPEIIRSSYAEGIIKPPSETERLKDAGGK